MRTNLRTIRRRILKAALLSMLIMGPVYELKAVTYDVERAEKKRLFFEFIPAIEGQLLGIAGYPFGFGKPNFERNWNIDYKCWHLQDGYEPDRGFTWIPFQDGAMLKCSSGHCRDEFLTWECANTGNLLSVRLYDPSDGGRKEIVGLPLRFHSGVTTGRAIAGASEFSIETGLLALVGGELLTPFKVIISEPFKATIGNDIQYVNLIQDNNGWRVIEDTNQSNIAVNERANLVAYITYENGVKTVGHMLIEIFPYVRPGAPKPSDGAIIQKAHSIPAPHSWYGRKLIIPYVQ